MTTSCIRRETVEVFADYHQFYLQDGRVSPPAPEVWTDADIARRAKVAPNIVVICPVRDMAVPVEVELHDAEPPFDTRAADHIVECSLALPPLAAQARPCRLHKEHRRRPRLLMCGRRTGRSTVSHDR